MALRQPGYFAAVAEELFIVQPSLYVQIVEPESDADGLLDPGIDRRRLAAARRAMRGGCPRVGG
jgi:hypothetical protein